MVRNIVILGGSSHPQLTETICNHLGVPPAKVALGKFSNGETRVQIEESVRGKDIFIIQSGGGKVNDHLMELLVSISACKTASASRVTAVLPLFPYSRHRDIPCNKLGTPLAKASSETDPPENHTFESRAMMPWVAQQEAKNMPNGTKAPEPKKSSSQKSEAVNSLPNGNVTPIKSAHFAESEQRDCFMQNEHQPPPTSTNGQSKEQALTQEQTKLSAFQPQRGYRQWVAQAGTLVADLVTCAGADHVITMDLHDPQYQGFFDIPVDNLYGRHLLRKYIQREIPNYQQAVVVSPDAGGAKRATAIADELGMPFALIHKERRPTRIDQRQNSTMMLVGDVAGRTAILVDDLADTCNTITRAAKLLRKEGATKVYALVTHGILSGDAIERIKASALDKVVFTNSICQTEHKKLLQDKLDVLEVGFVFAEAIRRVHHGESISVLFHYD